MTTDSTASADDASTDLHELGVLFVHGIGEQQQGSTLIAFGEPLYRWLDRWFDGIASSWARAGLTQAQESEWFHRHAAGWQRADDPSALADAFETRLRLAGHFSPDPPAGTTPARPLEDVQNDAAGGLLAARVSLHDAQTRRASTGSPSHAVMKLHALATDGTAPRASWLLAESWWAQTFFEPSRSELATWLIMVVPWSLGSHVGVRVRRARHHARIAATRLARLTAWSRVAGQLALLTMSLPVAVLIELLVGVVVLVGLIPLPAMRKVLVAAEQLLARTLGDSFVLVSSPLQQAAIIAQVQHDVAWLSARCHTVAVIAHSQGAAVAHRALRRQRPANVRLLLTFGSGLRKLEEMEHMARVDDGLFGRVYLTVAAVATTGYAVWALAAGLPGVLWSGATGAGLFVFLVLSYLSRAHALDAPWFTRLLREPRFVWADYHATDDPVSNGSLDDYDVLTGGEPDRPDAGPSAEAPFSQSVCNERSVLRDHTTYWENVEEFVGPVAMWLTWLTPPPWHVAVARTRTQRAPDVMRRHWRVGALVLHRWITIVAVAVIVVARWPAWLQIARWASSGVTAPLGKVLPSQGAAVVPLAPEPPAFEVWAVTAGALAAIVLVSRAGRMIWHRWTEIDQRTYFSLATPRTASAQARLDLFSAQWWFFSASALQALIVTLVAPALIGGVRPDVWTSASTVSVCGLVAAVAFARLSGRAVNGAQASTRAEGASSG